MKRLSPMQVKFVEQYLIDLNAKQAAIRAGYSQKTAEVIGYQLLQKPLVAQKISSLMTERSERTKIDADWVLRRLADQADADMSDLYTEGGTLKPVKDWPEVWRKGLVAGVDVIEEYERSEDGGRELIGHTKKVKLFDRMKNLELIGRHVAVGAFRDKVELQGRVDSDVKVDVSGMSSEALRELLEARKRASGR